LLESVNRDLLIARAEPLAVERSGSSSIRSNRGLSRGVRMCHNGTHGLAKMSVNYVEIISDYTGVDLTKAY
jgi:hypothetical protein